MDTFLQIGLSNSVTALALAVVLPRSSGLRGRRPALVHALWVLVLVKLITPPLFWISPAGKYHAAAPPAPVQTPQVVDAPRARSPSVLALCCPGRTGAGTEVRCADAVPPPKQPSDLQRTIATGVPCRAIRSPRDLSGARLIVVGVGCVARRQVPAAPALGEAGS